MSASELQLHFSGTVTFIACYLKFQDSSIGHFLWSQEQDTVAWGSADEEAPDALIFYSCQKVGEAGETLFGHLTDPLTAILWGQLVAAKMSEVLTWAEASSTLYIASYAERQAMFAEFDCKVDAL